MQYLSNQELLSSLLQGPCKEFTENGNGDWRDWSKKNPSLSLNLEKGFFNHKEGKGGPLRNLCLEYGLPIYRSDQGQKKTPIGNSNIDVQMIWEKSQRSHAPESAVFGITDSYFSDQRKIPQAQYLDLLKLGLIRFNLYKENRMLVYPSLSLETLSRAMEGKSFPVERIQRIFLNRDNSKKGKRHLGSMGNRPSAFVIPPMRKGTGKALLVEGIEDALSLRGEYLSHWMFVGTDKAGLKPAAEFIAGENFKCILIIADHDLEPESFKIRGQGYALRAGQYLKGKGIEVQVLMPPKPKSDANAALQKGNLKEWIRDLVPVDPLRKETAKESEWPEPEPLAPERVAGEGYPMDALSPTILNAVKEFIGYTPVPQALAGSVALGVAALASQHHANVRIDAQYVYPINLFLLIEQKSGERKSTVSRAFLKSVFRWEREQHEIWAHETDGEERSHPRLLYEDSTKESLVVDLVEGHRSAALWSDEAGVIFGGAGMNENSPMGYLTMLNKMFHGDKYVQRRKNSKSVELNEEGYRLSCVLMMQESILSHLLNLGKGKGSGWAEDTGFVTRCLFASPPSLIGSRSYAEAPEEIPAMDAFCERVFRLLTNPLPPDWVRLRKIYFNEAAKKLWIQEFNRAERLCAPGNAFAGFGGIVSKHAEHVARIAGVFNVFENAGDQVNEETMENAIRLAQWHLNEAQRIISAGSLRPEIRDAIGLLEWFRKQKFDDPAPLTTRDISQFGPNYIRNKERRDSVLKVLAEHHWLRIETRGKMKIIKLNPQLNNSAS